MKKSKNHPFVQAIKGHEKDTKELFKGEKATDHPFKTILNTHDFDEFKRTNTKGWFTT